jgi:hypothetical protein
MTGLLLPLPVVYGIVDRVGDFTGILFADYGVARAWVTKKYPSLSDSQISDRIEEIEIITEI